jgi:hypothetical protein
MKCAADSANVKGKFVIVGAQRTGSSALAEAVGMHPDIACGWEWTQRIAPSRKTHVAERALSGDFSVLADKHRNHMESVTGRSVIGFRRLFRSSPLWLFHPKYSPALWLDRLEDHIRWLARHPDIHVIHIVRRDNVAWLQSKALAALTGLYKGRPYPAEVRVRIPVRWAVRRVKSKNWVDARLASLSKTNPYLQSVYEEFLADNRAHTLEVVRFLGCDPSRLPPLDLRAKVQSGTRGAQVINLEELETTIRSDRPD